MRKAEKKDIRQIFEIVEDCFGKNYMTEGELIEHIESPESFLYLNEAGEDIAAISLYTVEEIDVAAENSKESVELLQNLSCGRNIVHCKFLCVNKKLQKGGYGKKLIKELEDYIEDLNISSAVYTVLCEYNNSIPAKGIFENNGFKFRRRLSRPWYGDESYSCPVCKGRCVCEGYTYFKKTGEVL